MKALEIFTCILVVSILIIAAIYIIPFALSILGAIISVAVPFIIIAVVLTLLGANKS